MKHIFYLLLMVMLSLSAMSQNIIPDDSTNINLAYVSAWYGMNDKVLVYQYEPVKQDSDIYQNELIAYKCRIKKVVTIRGGYLKLIVIKVNGENYTIGYHSYLAAINRFKIKDIFDDLENGKLNLIFMNNKLSLMYIE